MEEKKYPFDDNTMIYNHEEHRYVLTPEYVTKKTGIVLSNVLNPMFMTETQRIQELWLDELSETMYSWIYQFNGNNDMQEYVLAKHPVARNYIRNAMLQQVKYLLHNGDINQYSGVNVKTGQIMDRRLMNEVAISPNSQRELNKIIPGWGVAITYQGNINTPINLKIREDY